MFGVISSLQFPTNFPLPLNLSEDRNPIWGRVHQTGLPIPEDAVYAGSFASREGENVPIPLRFVRPLVLSVTRSARSKVGR